MKTKLIAVFALTLVSALNSQLSTASAQGTAFTYQGGLQNNGNPAGGTYSLTFALFNTNATGVAIAGPVTNNAVSVTNGLFTTAIDFGPGVFLGATNWLQIGVATNGVSSFTPLSPRQQLTPTPYAIYSANAGNAATATVATTAGSATSATSAATATTANNFSGSLAGDVTGTQGATTVSTVGSVTAANIASGANAANAATSANMANTLVKRDGAGNFSAGTITASSFSGNGANLTSLNVSQLAGVIPNNALPGFQNPYNTVGGGLYNTANGGDATVGGGDNNAASGSLSTVGGGGGNTAAGYVSSVAGGLDNNVSSTAFYSSVGGGYQNTLTNQSATIGGGQNNTNYEEYGTIAGGFDNLIAASPNISQAAAIGGGLGNTASNYYSTVPGGFYNKALGMGSFAAGSLAVALYNGSFVWADSIGGFGDTSSNQFNVEARGGVRFVTAGAGLTLDGNSVVVNNQSGVTLSGSFSGNGGSLTNLNSAQITGVIPTNALPGFQSPYNTIGGGLYNTAIGGDATVGGGGDNTASGGSSTVGGGGGNTAAASGSSVVGGLDNNVSSTAFYSSIGGGYQNTLTNQGATIGGGQNNTNYEQYGTIAGGFDNLITASTNNYQAAAIGGGLGNTASNYYSTVPGGFYNKALGMGSFAAGSLAAALYNGSFVWADSTGGFSDTTSNQFNVQAGGGVRFVTAGAGLTLDGNSVIVNNQTGVTLSGSFTGNAGGLTNLNSAHITGVIPNNALPGFQSPYNTVGGGLNNTAIGGDATVGGGDNNAASGSLSTVGGGGGNTAAGYVSSVAGGLDNNVSSTAFYSSVGGGYQNTLTNQSATIGGGQNNTNYEEYGTIAGGFDNLIAASPNISQAAAIGGGLGNTASNYYSTVPGGFYNKALGMGSFAAGSLAVALYNGSFVWADSIGGFGDTSSNQFNVEARGGVRFVTAGAGLTLDGNSVVVNNQSGVTLSGSFSGNGGSLTNLNSAQITGVIPTNALPGFQSPYNTIGGGNNNTASGGSTTVGGGFNNTATGGDSVIAGGVSNIVSGVAATIAGGDQNTVAGFNSAVLGGLGNSISNAAFYSIIGGGYHNFITNTGSYATIAGGESNQASANYATVAGGSINLAGGQSSIVGGGTMNVASGLATTVAGGIMNTSSGSYGTVAGGTQNTASFSFSSVGGGQNNTASGTDSTVGGGQTNTASGTDSTVGGGFNNTAGNYSTVGGGFQNNSRGVTFGDATVGGGTGNNATNDFSTVGGGQNNLAGGQYATVPGGSANLANGEYSLAAGQQAQATNQGAFVWADSENTPFASTNNDSFNVRAQGGVRILTYGAGMTLDWQSVLTGNNPNNGGELTNLNVLALTGTIPLGQLPANLVTNSEAGVTLSNLTLSGTAKLPGLVTVTAGGGKYLYSDGGGNFFLGQGAGNPAVSGFNNVSLGENTLAADTLGGNNTAIGYAALIQNTIGNNNTAIGYAALEDNQSGISNTAVGYFSLANNGSGMNNIALGYQAGLNITGDNNIDIGSPGVAGENYTMRIGSGQTETYIAGAIYGNGVGLTNLGSLGNNQLSTVTGTGGLVVGTNIYLENYPMYLRGDHNHGLAYNGGGITNFPSAAVQPDGPVLWGFTGGALGVLNGGAQAALSWNNSSVTVSNTLNVGGNQNVSSNLTVTGTVTATNTPGVNYYQTNIYDLTLPTDGATEVIIASCTNARPAAGYFVVMASAQVLNVTNNVTQFTIEDTAANNNLASYNLYPPAGLAYQNPNYISLVTLTSVVPITGPGSPDIFIFYLKNTATGGVFIQQINLTVMYFPRLNN